MDSSTIRAGFEYSSRKRGSCDMYVEHDAHLGFGILHLSSHSGCKGLTDKISMVEIPNYLIARFFTRSIVARSSEHVPSNICVRQKALFFSPGQNYAFKGSTGVPRQCLGTPNYHEQRHSGLGKYEPWLLELLLSAPTVSDPLEGADHTISAPRSCFSFGQ